MLLGGPRVDASAIVIEHEPVKCAVAERFPRMEAKLLPAEGIATAKVLFQSDKTDQWWSVAMKRENGVFAATLPQPRRTLKRFRYYIEVTDTALNTNRTPEHTTAVVAGVGECKGKVAAALAVASVLIEGPAGVPLPAGFAAGGVVAATAGAATGAAVGSGAAASAAAGGGLGTGVIVAGAAVAAAGTTLAVAAKKEDGEQGGGTSYSATFSTSWTLTQSSTGGNQTVTCSYAVASSGSAEAFVPRSGSAGPGKFNLQFTSSASLATPSPNCGTNGPGNGPDAIFCEFSNGTSDLRCSNSITNTINGFTTTRTVSFAGTLSGGAINATAGYSNANSGTGSGGTPTTTSGSFTLNLTLR